MSRQTDLENQLWNYLNRTDDREQAADRRSADLIRAHETGWKLVARAVETGLRGVADAIRDHGRR